MSEDEGDVRSEPIDPDEDDSTDGDEAPELREPETEGEDE